MKKNHDTNPEHDPYLDAFLSEAVGGRRPPDLSDRILDAASELDAQTPSGAGGKDGHVIPLHSEEDSKPLTHSELWRKRVGIGAAAACFVVGMALMAWSGFDKRDAETGAGLSAGNNTSGTTVSPTIRHTGSSGTAVTGTDDYGVGIVLANLESAEELRTLNAGTEGIRYTGFYGRDLAELSRFVNLRRLVIEDLPNRDHVPDVAMGEGLDDAALSNLSGLHALERLELVRLSEITGTGLEHVAALPNLRAISLIGCGGLVDSELAPIARFATLKSLEVENGLTVTDAALGHIAGAISLEALNLSGCAVTDAGMASLSVMLNLTELNLGDTKIGDSGLASLANISTLRKLDLSAGPNNDSGMKTFRPNDFDTIIHPAAAPITDDGIAHLQRLPNLEHIDLSGVVGGVKQTYVNNPPKPFTVITRGKITNEGLRRLSLIPTLKIVRVARNFDITDEGIKNLSTLMRLENLDVTGCTGITRDGLVAVAGLLPACRITEPTGTIFVANPIETPAVTAPAPSIPEIPLPTPSTTTPEIESVKLWTELLTTAGVKPGMREKDLDAVLEVIGGSQGSNNFKRWSSVTSAGADVENYRLGVGPLHVDVLWHPLNCEWGGLAVERFSVRLDMHDLNGYKDHYKVQTMKELEAWRIGAVGRVTWMNKLLAAGLKTGISMPEAEAMLSAAAGFKVSGECDKPNVVSYGLEYSSKQPAPGTDIGPIAAVSIIYDTNGARNNDTWAARDIFLTVNGVRAKWPNIPAPDVSLKPLPSISKKDLAKLLGDGAAIVLCSPGYDRTQNAPAPERVDIDDIAEVSKIVTALIASLDMSPKPVPELRNYDMGIVLYHDDPDYLKSGMGMIHATYAPGAYVRFELDGPDGETKLQFTCGVSKDLEKIMQPWVAKVQENESAFRLTRPQTVRSQRNIRDISAEREAERIDWIANLTEKGLKAGITRKAAEDIVKSYLSPGHALNMVEIYPNGASDSEAGQPAPAQPAGTGPEEVRYWLGTCGITVVAKYSAVEIKAEPGTEPYYVITSFDVLIGNRLADGPDGQTVEFEQVGPQVLLPSGPWMGITGQDAPKEQGGGIVILSVVPGSPAEQAGLKTNDHVITIDGDNKSWDGVIHYIRGKKAGEVIRLEIKRLQILPGDYNKPEDHWFSQVVNVTLAERPAQQSMSRNGQLTDEPAQPAPRNGDGSSNDDEAEVLPPAPEKTDEPAGPSGTNK